jgi:hypothetical protein
LSEELRLLLNGKRGGKIRAKKLKEANRGENPTMAQLKRLELQTYSESFGHFKENFIHPRECLKKEWNLTNLWIKNCWDNLLCQCHKAD